MSKWNCIVLTQINHSIALLWPKKGDLGGDIRRLQCRSTSTSVAGAVTSGGMSTPRI